MPSPNRTKLYTGGTVLQRTERFITPARDTRTYRGLVLANQLKVLLISDATCTKSFANVSVNVGSLANPMEHQGLAHLLEHVLLNSPTRKFPEEPTFRNFVRNHHGRSNGETYEHHTVYYFRVNSDLFEQSLDRFAQLFVEAVLKREMVEREIGRVHDEFESSLADGYKRCMRIAQVTCNESSHPFAKFAIGNKHTLKMEGDKLFNALCEFYLKWYSANMMTLVVLDKEPLDKLESVVVGLFGQIANHNCEPFRIEQPLCPYKYSRQETKIVPIHGDISVDLCVFFATPDSLHEAIYVLQFLMQYSSEDGSLRSIFVPKGRHFNDFTVSFIESQFAITFSTVGHKQSRIFSVMRIFQYFEMIKSTPPEQLKRVYCEVQTMAQSWFDYPSKNINFDYITQLSLNLQKYPFEEVLSRAVNPIHDSALGEFNHSKLMEVFKYLNVDCVNIQFISASVKKEPIKLQTEPIYGVEYAVEDIEGTVLDRWKNCGLGQFWTLPSASPFVPSDFELKPNDNPPLEHPTELAIEYPELRVWHLHDSIFRVPQAFVAFRIKCPFIKTNAQNHNLTKQFVAGFRKALVGQFCYQTKIIFKGFNHKLDTFIYALFEQLIKYDKRPRLVKNTFTKVDEDDVDDDYIINLLKKYIYEIFKSEFSVVLNQKDTKPSSDFKCQLFANFQVQVLIHGNVTQEESICLSKKVFGMLSKLTTVMPESSSNKVNQFPQKLKVQLKRGITRFECTDPESNLNCLYTTFQIDKPANCASMAERSKLDSCSKWFRRFLSPLYFTQLREKEQLAYSIDVMYRKMIIQSSYSVEYLWSRTEAFIESIEKILIDLPEQAVTKLKDDIIDSIRSTNHNLYKRSAQQWKEITSGKTFDKVSSMAAITKDDLLTFYRDYIREDGPECRRLLIMVKGGKCEHKIGKESMANLHPLYIQLQYGKTFKSIEDLKRERTDLV